MAAQTRPKGQLVGPISKTVPRGEQVADGQAAPAPNASAAMTKRALNPRFLRRIAIPPRHFALRLQTLRAGRINIQMDYLARPKT